MFLICSFDVSENPWNPNFGFLLSSKLHGSKVEVVALFVWDYTLRNFFCHPEKRSSYMYLASTAILLAIYQMLENIAHSLKKIYTLV
jgi:hypothetical protein